MIPMIENLFESWQQDIWLLGSCNMTNILMKKEYYPSGNIRSQSWFNEQDQLHIDVDPAHIYYGLNGTIMHRVWYWKG
jgi:hypothetical protein